MARARLYVQERGTSALTQHGEFDTAAYAQAKGVELLELGSVTFFEVWERRGAYRAKIAIEEVD